MMKKLLLLLPLLLAACGTGSREPLFTPGTGCVPYACDGPFAGDTIGIYYHVPEGYDVASMPVQFVIAGMNRNADKYRDDWVAKADEYGFVLLVPDLDEEHFPERVYQQGAVQDEAGGFNAPEDRVYPLVDKVFRFFLENSRSHARGYNIYGHSAGAQFVHRYLLFNKTPEVDRAVSANAGWYTFPTDTKDYPYGIGQSASQIGTDVAAYYQKNLIILLGTADTLRTESFNQSKKAEAQGHTRLERGKNFFEYCKSNAANRGIPFHWENVFVEGVGHSDSKMAPYAAKLLYGGR
jgi:hypothetical protein